MPYNKQGDTELVKLLMHVRRSKMKESHVSLVRTTYHLFVFGFLHSLFEGGIDFSRDVCTFFSVQMFSAEVVDKKYTSSLVKWVP